MESHLLQMRGLKPCIGDEQDRRSSSHLLQMRGLKLLQASIKFNTHMSHLLQMRGLKRDRNRIIAGTKCRIFYRCVD